jgi:NAD(P)H-flavin reductase
MIGIYYFTNFFSISSPPISSSFYICFNTIKTIPISWKGYNKFGNAKDSLFYDIEYQSGTTAAIGFLLVYLTSFEIIRRSYSEVFYYSHILGVLLAVAALFAHQYGAIAFLAPGVFLWFADRAMRYYNSHYRQTVTVAIEANDGQTFARVLFKKEGLENNFVPGQYVFLAVRQSKGIRRLFETLNWHPFTISEILPAYDETHHDKLLERGKITEVVDTAKNEKSIREPTSTSPSKSPTMSSQNDSVDTAVSSGVASVHIKGLGNMTKRLLYNGQTKNEQIQVSVDGPFGANSLHFQDFETVVLFSAGVGVTPSLSILKDLVEKRSKGYLTVRTKTIHFLWSLQKMGKLCFPQTIDSIFTSNNQLLLQNMHVPLYHC